MKSAQWVIIKHSFFILVLWMFAPSVATAQTISKKNCDVCEYWESKVNFKIKLLEDYPKLDSKDEKTILQAIDCLLKLEGNDNDSGFGTGGTSTQNSNAYSSPTVEVAALYYITELYLQDFPYWAIRFVDKNGKQIEKESLKTVYQSYREWYKKIKEIGLTKARQIKLDPLDGTNIYWYGPRR